MADPQDDILSVRIVTDEASARRSQSLVKSYRDELRATAAEAKKTDLAIREISSDVRKAFDGRGLTEYRNELKGATADMSALRREVISAAAAQEKLAQSRSGSGANVLGTAGRALGAVSPGAGAFLRDIQDIQQFGSAVGESGRIALGAGIGIGAATVALSLLREEAAKTKEAATAELNSRAEVLRFLQTASNEEVRIRADEVRQKREIDQSVADDANRLLADLRRNIEQQYGAVGLAIAEVNAKLGTGNGELSAAIANADAANKALGETSTALTLLDQAAAAGSGSERDYAKSIEESNKAREASIPKLEALALQAADLLRRNGEQVHEITSERLTRSLREEEDYANKREADETRHRANLTKIGLQGQERLVQIHQQGVKRIEAADAEIGKLLGQRGEIDARYMADERKAVAEFRDAERKETKRANDERLRLLEDLHDSLFDAEISNNVIAFNAAKRQGDKDLRRLNEGVDEAARERQDQFLKEREAAQENHAAAVANIQTEIAEKQAARAIIEAENQAALDAERSRIKQAKDEAQAAFNEQIAAEDAARDLRLKRQKEDEDRADQKRENALQRALADIDAKVQAEAKGIGLIGQSFTNLVNAVRNGTVSAINAIVSRAGTMGSSGSYNSPSISGSGSFGSRASILRPPSSNGVGNARPPMAFHEGGKPAVEGWGWLRSDERVLNPRQTREWETGMRSGGSEAGLNLTIYQTVGDVATLPMAMKIAEKMAGEVREDVLVLLKNVRTP
jgi:hypothetical protein